MKKRGNFGRERANALVAVCESNSLHGGKFNFHYLSLIFIWVIRHSYSYVNSSPAKLKEK